MRKGKWIWLCVAVLGTAALCGCAWAEAAWGFMSSPEGQDAGIRAAEGIGKIASGNPIEGGLDIISYLYGIATGGATVKAPAAVRGVAKVVRTAREKRKQAKADAEAPTE